MWFMDIVRGLVMSVVRAVKTQLKKVYNIRLHTWLGIMVVWLGVTLQMSPGFAFSGGLVAINRTLAEMYGLPFVIGGTALAVRRPERISIYYILLSPVLFHYLFNAVRVIGEAVRGDVGLLPVAPLYFIPVVVLMYHLHKEYKPG